MAKSWISNIIGNTLGTLVSEVGQVVDDLNLSGEEKLGFKLRFEELLQKRFEQVEQSLRAETQAKERIMVAEMAQGDSFTKRARPMLVYMGLAFIAINHVLIPAIGSLVAAKAGGAFNAPALSLPTEFWYAWTGAVSVWILGRSMEKRGTANTGLSKAASLITGG